MIYRNLTIIYILLAGTATAVDEPDPGSDPIILHHCKIGYAQSSLVGSSEWGAIQESFVTRGSTVKAGQILAHLHDGEARAEMLQRAVESRSDVALRSSLVRHKQALLKFEISSALRQRHAVSAEQVNVDKLEAEQAGLAVEQEKERRVIAKHLYDKAEAKVRARQIISPHDGVVSEVIKKPGEAVQIGEQVFRMDNTDRLHVVGKADVGDWGRIQVGDSARIRVEIGGADLPIEREIFTGKIVFLDTKVEPTTQMCTVIAECDNRDQLLRAGQEASLEIEAERKPNQAVVEVKRDN